MNKDNKYVVLNMKTLFNDGESKEVLSKLINEFECDKNVDIESFLKKDSIKFSKQNFTETFFVFCKEKDKFLFVGYFAITYKFLEIEDIVLTGKDKQEFKKFIFEENGKKYIGMPLIAQLGKNYYNGFDKKIDGDVLLRFALNRVKTAQNIIGGSFVYLECENVEYLKSFYTKNGFKYFGERDIEEGKTLLQLAKNMKKFEVTNT